MGTRGKEGRAGSASVLREERGTLPCARQQEQEKKFFPKEGRAEIRELLFLPAREHTATEEKNAFFFIGKGHKG